MMAGYTRVYAILVLALVTAVTASAPQKKDIDSARVFLRGVPVDATVEVNGVPVLVDPAQPLLIKPGSMQIALITKNASVVKSFFMRGGDYRILNFNNNPDYAAIDVITEPPGAELYLDGERKGTTPYLDSLVLPGTFMLAVRKNGFDPVEKKINLLPQEDLELTIDLTRSKAWLDSVAHAAKKRRQQRQSLQRLVTSALGAACCGAAFYFNRNAGKKIEHAEAVSAAYDGADNGFDALREQYFLERERAAVSIRRRDALGGLAGVMALGFSLSFVF